MMPRSKIPKVFGGISYTEYFNFTHIILFIKVNFVMHTFEIFHNEILYYHLIF